MKKRRTLTDDEVDALVIAEVDDPSAWGEPIVVTPSRSRRPARMAQAKHLDITRQNDEKTQALNLFTPLQGQYLAVIHAYSKLNGRSPSEADLQRHFRVTPPTVHQMVLMLERKGFISRVPGQARSIHLLIGASTLPPIE